MTHKEKLLLIKDLCARLPYGPKVWYPNGSGAISTVKGIIDDICYFNENPKYGNFCRIDTIKPYLRPMSSMTEKEKREYQAFFNYDGVEYPEEYIDWLISRHFDYRGLIPMGLALEAKEGTYKV